MSHTVVGIFDKLHDAQRAVEHLVTDGISRDKIDLSVEGTNTSGTSSNSNYTTSTTASGYDRHDKKDESFGDSISNFFSNLFSDDEDEARRYSSVADRGNIVTVHTSSREESERAAYILDQYGTVDVNERSRGYSNSNRNSGDTINVIEEELQVGKREVETGSVRLKSRIVERPVEEKLRLREERVWVERNAVNRPATEGELANFSGETIELTQHAEIPVVAKEARVVEEIKIGKTVEEHEQTIQDTVRRTEVDIDEDHTRKDNLGLGRNS